MKPINEDDVTFHGHEQTAQRLPVWYETGVKRGDRVVGGAKELVEKLGRNDPCPCGYTRSFQALLAAQRLLLTAWTAITTGVERTMPMINEESCPSGKGLAC